MIAFWFQDLHLHVQLDTEHHFHNADNDKVLKRIRKKDAILVKIFSFLFDQLLLTLVLIHKIICCFRRENNVIFTKFNQCFLKLYSKGKVFLVRRKHVGEPVNISCYKPLMSCMPRTSLRCEEQIYFFPSADYPCEQLFMKCHGHNCTDRMP